MVNMERRRYGRVVLLGSGPDGGCMRWCPAVCRLSPGIEPDGDRRGCGPEEVPQERAWRLGEKGTCTTYPNQFIP
jgi:hypothetical protein